MIKRGTIDLWRTWDVKRRRRVDRHSYTKTERERERREAGHNSDPSRCNSNSNSDYFSLRWMKMRRWRRGRLNETTNTTTTTTITTTSWKWLQWWRTRWELIPQIKYIYIYIYRWQVNRCLKSQLTMMNLCLLCTDTHAREHLRSSMSVLCCSYVITTTR